jgi:8-oxo-dGTP diphosphatase
MSLAGQNPQPGRYTIIPRTLSFLLSGGDVLLIRLPEDGSAWSGCLNGVGGHIEQGEDPLSAARREIVEETGISPLGLTLSGVVIVDIGSKTGVGLYVFIGKAPDGAEIRAGQEGTPEWISLKALEQHDVVEDLPALIPRALTSYKENMPFSAVYTYDQEGNLSIHFAP